MTEVCVLSSKDYVMNNEKRNLEKQWRISDKHKINDEENEDRCKPLKARCVMLVNMNVKTVTLNDTVGRNDSEHQTQKDDDSRCLNKYVQWLWTLELRKRWWLKMHEWVWRTALNAKTKKIDDSKSPKERVQWLWMPEMRKMVMDWTKDRHEDSECWTKTATRNTK